MTLPFLSIIALFRNLVVIVTPAPLVCTIPMTISYVAPNDTIDSGHLALLSPSCRLPVAVLGLLAPCRSPVACLSLSCRSPVAPLSLPCRFPVAFLPPSCRYPVASCRFLLFPVAMLIFAWRLPVALLSLSCRSLPSLSCRYFLLPPCRPPVACLSSSCRLPVASLSPPCRLPVAQCGNLSLSCCLPVACLSPSCRLPVASLSPPCRPMCYPIDGKPQTPQTGSSIITKMFFVHAKL